MANEYRDGLGRFKKGTHWRTPQPFRNKEWLVNKYCVEKKSTGEIAKMFSVSEPAILHWMRKHGIERRSISSARAVKRWGAVGKDNLMYGRTGELNPRWQGGISAERPLFYQSTEWKAACSEVWKRDGSSCRRCGTARANGANGKSNLDVHHIVPFANKDLRAVTSNLVLLCKKCHRFVHSKRNVNREYLP
jgi:predicted GIY-YIG superfamily endonuclease/RNA polymerase subunit RPABC4/transcription elongation factor Spt4